MMDAYAQYEDKKAEAEEKTGQDADEEAIAEQQEGIDAAREQMSSLPKISLPTIPLDKFPNMEIKGGNGPDAPSGIALPDLPPIDLQELSEFVDFRPFLTELATKGTSKLSECTLPSIPMQALSKLGGKLFETLNENIPDEITCLPECILGDIPGISLPHINDEALSSVPFVQINIKKLNVSMPLDVPKVDTKTLKIKLKQMGGMLMKVKLMLGFTQCLSMIPTIFNGIQWPVSFVLLSQFLNIASIDVMGLFGDMCAFHTGFLPKFLTQMLLIPIVVVVLAAMFVCLETLGPKMCAKRFKFTTKESRSAAMFNVAFLTVYTFYTNISTSIFQLFKCHPIEGRYYLVADYTVKCWEDEWYPFMGIAIAGIFLYTIGIPLFLFYKLYNSRDVLHSDNLPPERHAEHAMAQKQLGSVYGDYSNDAYYFDLIDLFRRIVLTGALVLVGEGGGAQIFLGSIICLIWLTLVVAKRPYGAFWDNTMSAVLSFQLLLVTLIGMALTINQKTPQDEKDPMEDVLFEIVLTGASILIIIAALSVIVMSVPCLATRIYNEDAEEEAEEVEEEEVEEEEVEKVREEVKVEEVKDLAAFDGIEMVPLESSKE